jgi:hypothetical protein
MTEETAAPPPAPAPAPPPPGDPPPAGESLDARLARLEERMDDVEAVASASVMMQLEDDEPEKTTVEPRTETPPAEDKPKDETTPPAEEPTRHSGLFS